MSHRRKLVLPSALSLFFVSASVVYGQAGAPSYYDQLKYNFTSPTTYPSSVSAFANPAVLGMLPGEDYHVTWTASQNDYTSFTEYGIFVGWPRLGFGFIRNRVLLDDGRDAKVEDYRLGLSDTRKGTSLGIAYGWSTGTDVAKRSDLLQLGFAQRFWKFATLGAAGNFAFNDGDRTGLFDVSIRPLFNHWITVFGDFELPRGISIEEAPWSVGTRVELIRGVPLTGRYFKDEGFAVSLSVSFGIRWRVGYQPRFDTEGNGIDANADVRFGFPERSILEEFFDYFG